MKAKRHTRREARQLFRLCMENGRLNAARVRAVTRRIIERKYRGYVELLWQLHRFVKLECDQHTAEITSASPLQKDLRDRITNQLERLYGSGLESRFVQMPELIGGVRVVVGNDVYDDSVRYRLAELQRSFSAASGWQKNR